MTYQRLEILSLTQKEKMEHLCSLVNQRFENKLNSIKEVKIYLLKDINIKNNDLLSLQDVFCDTITERFYDKEHSFDDFHQRPNFVVEVFFRGGVTDNSAKSAQEALKLLNYKISVASGKTYCLWGESLDLQTVKNITFEFLANDLIQKCYFYTFDSFLEQKRFENVNFPKVDIQHDAKTEVISLDKNQKDLEKLSQERCLALSLDEFSQIKDYFESEKERREKRGLPAWPTDVELEIIAQSWSEHCKHKIFAAHIDYSEGEHSYKKIERKEIKSLYKSYIKKATFDVIHQRSLDWAISVFSDNAGVVRFDPQIDLCVKVETHNSPSALDPYGGALTGILGVNRDILGCGMGARPIANCDVFCFAPHSWPHPGLENNMPEGPKGPRLMLEGVHKGIEDGGNKSGIPTINGSLFFDADYAGKPLVFCGTVGVMPQKLKSGIKGHAKMAKVSDRIYMVGGAIGADGIHGATFSSLELNENSPMSAVQIGDPLTQKRMTDFLLKAQDLELYTAITDNGAGGLSSSVGEMATLTNGAKLDLSLALTKYPGLAPYELMISESQERMTVAVDPKKCVEFESLALEFGVDVSNLGEFNNSGFLDVYYSDEIVASLDLHFLHESLRPMQLKAYWDGPRSRPLWSVVEINKTATHETGEFIEKALKRLLRSPNIASKEALVRRYDHEVGGATNIKPFMGKTQQGPSDAGVIWLYPHGGDKNSAMVLGHGLAPRLSLYDPYLMAQYAVDEAVRNVIATGGQIDKLCLLDNFCWPDPVLSAKNPEGDYRLGQLVRTCEGLYDACMIYGLPLVSGKDSMKNDFKGVNKKGDPLNISILPTLLVTAMSYADVRKTVSSDFKKAGDKIYLLGAKTASLVASEFSQYYQIENESLPELNLNKNKKLYEKMNEGVKNELFNSLHDVSDGGPLISIAESCFGNDLGANLFFFQNELIPLLFGEGDARFVASIDQEREREFLDLFSQMETLCLGEVTSRDLLYLENNEQRLFETSLTDLKAQWKGVF